MTEAEHLQAWFPMRIHGDWVVGGPLTFADPEGRGPEFTGKVLARQPPSVLEFSWGPDVLRLEIEARGAGCSPPCWTRSTSWEGGAGRGRLDVRLDLLAAHLDGSGPAGPTWSQVHPEYVTAFGPEAATIGPPPGYGPDDNG